MVRRGPLQAKTQLHRCDICGAPELCKDLVAFSPLNAELVCPNCRDISFDVVVKTAEKYFRKEWSCNGSYNHLKQRRLCSWRTDRSRQRVVKLSWSLQDQLIPSSVNYLAWLASCSGKWFWMTCKQSRNKTRRRERRLTPFANLPWASVRDVGAWGCSKDKNCVIVISKKDDLVWYDFYHTLIHIIRSDDLNNHSNTAK